MLQNGTPLSCETAPQYRTRRGAERHAHAERVALTTQWGEVDSTLIDLSRTGVQVRLANGLVPMEGDDVTLRLIDGRHIAGVVTWTGTSTLGISFDQPLACVEDILWVEQRGPEWFYGVSNLRR